MGWVLPRHSVYWLLVWDLTTDPLGNIWLVFPVFAAIFTGLIFSVLLVGRLKLWGLGYTLLEVGLLVSVVFQVWYLLSLPEPVIIFGQDWCFDGAEDTYRLGYVDRLHWSDPHLFGHIYRMQGELIALQLMCCASFSTTYC